MGRRSTDKEPGPEDRLLIVSYKKAYGKDFFYPINPLAIMLTGFANCETFTKDQMKILKKLGYSFEIKIEDLDLED